jgi:hypothetical protein
MHIKSWNGSFQIMENHGKYVKYAHKIMEWSAGSTKHDFLGSELVRGVVEDRFRRAAARGVNREKHLCVRVCVCVRARARKHTGA